MQIDIEENQGALISKSDGTFELAFPSVSIDAPINNGVALLTTISRLLQEENEEFSQILQSKWAEILEECKYVKGSKCNNSSLPPQYMN